MTFDLKSVALSLTDLNEAAEKDTKGGNRYNDDRFWKPTTDDAGNGFAEIRFLPPAKGENLPWVSYYDYFFRGPTNQTYFERSLQTLDQADPVLEHNGKLWADKSGSQADIEARQNDVRTRRRRLNYLFNILVVNDPKVPENNGKVFLYRTGKTVFDQIKEAMNPNPEHGEEGIAVFDFLLGANYKLKLYNNKAGFPQYDKCGFASPSQLFDGDVKLIEEVYNQIYPLQAEIAPDKFKTYAELQAKMNRVLCLDIDGNSAINTVQTIEGTPDASEEMQDPIPASDTDEAPEEDADPAAYFKKMAEQENAA